MNAKCSAAFFLLLASTGLSVTARTLSTDEINDFVVQTLAKYEVPGAAVVVVQNGEIIVADGYGVKDLGDPDDPVDGDTLFQLASVSKTFTAAAVAAAVDQDRLEWKQPVVEVIPEFQLMSPAATELSTAVDFLTHRAGFQQFFGDLFDHLGYSRSEVVQRLRYAKPAYTFRDHPEYSNIGFFLAGETAAEAMGTTFEEVLQTSIFEPLQMARTGVAAEMIETDSNWAWPHATIGGETVVVPNNLSRLFVAAGGLASTANDLAHYLQMMTGDGTWSGGKVLSETSMETLFTPVIASEIGFAEAEPISEGTGFNYSPGWGVYYYNNHRIFEKGGALDGYRTVVVVVPEARLGIAVLCNMNLSLFPEAVRAWVLQKVIGLPDEPDLQAAIAEHGQRVDEIFSHLPEPPTDAEPPTHSTEAYLGTYESDLFGSWRMVLNQDDDADAFPWLVLAGPDAHQGKVRSWDGDELAVVWPVVLTFPTPIDFKFDEGMERAVSFVYEGYEFTRVTAED